MDKDSNEKPEQFSPPKRDKFAAMASRQQEDDTDTAAASTLSPPKRDKLAALASGQSAETSLDNKEESSAALTSPSAGSTQTQPAPKRDKFAAMGQSSSSSPSQPRRDKFASMSADNKQKKQEETLQQQQEKQKEQRQKLKERCEQRAPVWKDLERAQAWTIQLLDIAQETAQVLGKGDIITSGNSNNSSSYERLSALSSRYSDTLNDLHACLEPHAHFVKAYTDQPPPPSDDDPTSSSSQQLHKNRMYASRVDLRIAKSRKALLQDILEHEQQQQQLEQDDSTNGDRKRKREEGM